MFKALRARSFSHWVTITAIAASVSACGGGGGGESPSTQTPAPIGGDPAPSGQETIGQPPGQVQGRFFATVSRVWNGNTRQDTHTLAIIDTDTNQIVKSILLDNTGEEVSRITYDLDIDLDRRSYSYKGQRAVYFIKDGRVFRLALNQSALAEPRQISSLTTACGLRSSSNSSTDDLFVVEARLPSETCATASYSNAVQLQSSMTEKDIALPTTLDATEEIFDPKQPLSPVGILVHDTINNKLYAYSNNLQNKLYLVSTPEGVLTQYSDIDLNFEPKENSQTLKIGSALFKAELIDGRLVIGSRIKSSTGFDQVKKVVSLQSGTFVLYTDNRFEQYVDSHTTTHITTLPAETGAIQDWREQGDLIIAEASEDASSSSDSISTYFQIDPKKKTWSKWGQLIEGALEHMLIKESEHAWMLTRAEKTSTRYSLIKRSIQTGTSATILADIIPVGPQITVHDLSARLDRFVYCTPLPSRNDCAGAKLISRNMLTGAEIQLGQYDADPSWLQSSASIDDPLSPGNFAVISVWNRTGPLAYHSTIWSYNPEKANSLKQLTQPN